MLLLEWIYIVVGMVTCLAVSFILILVSINKVVEIYNEIKYPHWYRSQIMLYNNLILTFNRDEKVKYIFTKLKDYATKDMLPDTRRLRNEVEEQFKTKFEEEFKETK